MNVLDPVAVFRMEAAELFEQLPDPLHPLVVAVAEALLAPELDHRHVWIRVGGARYFTGGERPADARVRCPADADLTAAVSAAAQREAESRAEACFAQALARGDDWRAIR